jgi:ABC-type dipeptide/oligopeptide/nickel transport system permease subunit
MSAASVLTGERQAHQPAAIPRGVCRRLLRRRSAQCGVALTLILGLGAIIGPLLLTQRPEQTNTAQKLRPPSFSHPLGTDQFGRDQLARLLDGGRRSLGAAVIVLAGVLFVSIIVGVTAGMIGGIVDTGAMRFLDVILSIPSMALALAVVGVMGVGYENLLLAITASSWAYYARIARSCVRLARSRQDVIADRLAGVSWPRIVGGHVIPGVVVQLLVIATLDVSGVIIRLAGLSFLGLGVQPPDAEWGAMLAESRLYFTVAPWLLLSPATAILLSVAAANMIGNALRDAADVGGGQ